MAYDAGVALALAFNSSSNPYDSRTTLAALSGVHFDGASGTVSFDDSLDRKWHAI